MTTVVFTDLVGSTGLYERLGDAAASRFVTELTGLLSQVFEQHTGRVVKLLGDGLFVVFAQEGDALAACMQIQKRLLEPLALSTSSRCTVHSLLDWGNSPRSNRNISVSLLRNFEYLQGRGWPSLDPRSDQPREAKAPRAP